jgi:hypothetical protein
VQPEAVRILQSAIQTLDAEQQRLDDAAVAARRQVISSILFADIVGYSKLQVRAALQAASGSGESRLPAAIGLQLTTWAETGHDFLTTPAVDVLLTPILTPILPASLWLLCRTAKCSCSLSGSSALWRL